MTHYKFWPKQRSIILIIVLWVCSAFYGFSQTKITGKVISVSDNEGLPGVTVLLKGTSTGTVTDVDGNYSITVNSANDVLVYSMVGMAQQEITVGSQSVINVSLDAKVTGLDEVVVVGYGTVKKSDLTGAVSTVKSKELTAIPVTDALESLQGKVAGLDLTKSSGQAGATMNFSIRGNRSITAEQPPLILVDGVDYGSSLDINPNDIQSVEVLKDGSSTAIYGSRGANGVIIITTKRGNAGKTKISINSYYGLNTVSEYPQFTNGPQWMDMAREANSGIGRTSGVWKSIADDPKIFNKYALAGDYVDWRKLLIHDGNNQSHQINISGGDTKTTYSISGEYGKEQGILKFDNLERYTGRMTLDHKIYSWLKIGTNMAYTYTNQNIRANPFNMANKIEPVGIPFDTVTGQINPFPLYDGNTISPLVEEISGVKSDNKVTKRFFSSDYIEITPFSGLTLKSNLGVDYTNISEGIFSGALSFSQLNTYSTASVENKSSSKLLWENTITYNQTMDIHEFQIMGGTSTQVTENEDYLESGNNLLTADQLWYNLHNAADGQAINSSYTKSQLASFFGRLNYKLKDKYLLTATLRWDGASQLAQGHKGQFFPSVAVGWKIKDENFLKDVDVITSLKLRASYGLSGNSAVQPYSTQGVLGQTVYSYGETSAYGYYPEYLPNKNLSWETTADRDLGIDFGFVKNRITGTINYYYQNTYNLLLNEAIPPSTGYPFVISNIGKTQDNGIEINISTVNINNSNDGFKWTTDLTFSTNKEKILDLGPGVNIIYDNNYSSNLIVYQVGQPIHSYLNYNKIGIWQRADSLTAQKYGAMPGDIKLQDVNKDSTINTSDRIIKGHANPTWTGGLNNTFSYKGFELSFFIYARVGQTVNYEGNYGWKYAGDANTTVQDYWTYSNPTNSFPRPGNGSAGAYTKTYISTLGLVDGSYFKIRDITFAYTLPEKWASSLKMSKFRIYTTMKNYFTFSKIKGFDPENENTSPGSTNYGNSALSFPMTKQWVFGLNLDF